MRDLCYKLGDYCKRLGKGENVSGLNTLRFWVNGTMVEESNVSPTTTLLNYLRYHLNQTGTKEGCAEGDCGACTVAIIDPDAPNGATFRAVNSCLVLLPMVQGKEIVTVEGLRQGKHHHPVQEELVQELGSQCGYCTPGVIMSMFEACYRDDLNEDWKLDDQMCGNLCRCTGYRPIMDATRKIAGQRPDDQFTEALTKAESRSMGLNYQHGEQRYFNPTTFDELWDILDQHPDARFVVGGTDLSLEVTKQFKTLPLLVSLEGIRELRRLEQTEDGWHLGSAAVLSDVEAAVAQSLPSLERMLRFFGARQIKNRGTVGGNLCTASPIGDLPPVLLSLGALATLRSRQGTRQIPLDDFFLGYRQTALQQGEILDSIQVPVSQHPDLEVRSCSYKVSKRQELDISTVSAGLYVALSASGEVQTARFAFGGMAATPARASLVEQAVIGKPWTSETVEQALSLLAQDFTPIDDHRGSAWYRQKVAGNLLRGFFLETQDEKQPRLPYRPTGTVVLEVTS